MVATSTVDVGVDFRINLLIFESLSARHFYPKIGPSGEARGYPVYQAIALLPGFLVERLKLRYADECALERPTFFQVLRDEVFPEHRRFEEFIPRWGQ